LGGRGKEEKKREKRRVGQIFSSGDALDDFEEFWKLYPRKVARAHALKMWRRLTTEEKFAALHALPVHIRYWDAAGRDADRIPHAGSWLNPVDGRRWEDELEMPKPKDEMGEWWKTTAGILRKALSVGLTPKAGEDYPQLKARILAKERSA
jgi:hypothetical protein